MPNHCVNELIVSGSTDEKARFLKMVGENLDFDRIIPYPEEFKKLDEAAEAFDKQEGIPYANGRPKDGFNSGGYEWCVANWGTKWGSYNVEFSDGFYGTRFRFQTAWSPPIPVFRKLCEMFPLLGFELNYWECGTERRGTLYRDQGDDDDTSAAEIVEECGRYVGGMCG